MDDRAGEEHAAPRPRGSAEILRQELRRIDGRGYPVYKDLRGSYDFPGFTLLVDHVQGDPFAAPSRVRVRVPAETAGFPAELRRRGSRETALRDFLTRRFGDACRRFVRGDRGSGRSGLVAIDRPGQEVLERTSVLVAEDGEIEARFVMGLPAFGRSVAAQHAQAMFFEELPRIVEASLLYRSLDASALREHVETVEDADFLRAELRERGLVAFVAEDAVFPRASGVDPRPLRSGKVVPFRSPESFRVEIDLPNRGRIAGMGIPGGVTLIVGGGYHGKSTLLRALQDGVYDHLPGDGRELVVTDPSAVKIRAEDGRREVRISAKGLQSIDFGTHHIDLGAVEQLVDPSQTRAVGDALYHATRHMDGRRTVGEVVGLVMQNVAAGGLDVLSDRPAGDHAVFRPFELAAAMNRLRTLEVRKLP